MLRKTSPCKTVKFSRFPRIINHYIHYSITLPETNSEVTHENELLEDYLFLFGQGAYFRVVFGLTFRGKSAFGRKAFKVSRAWGHFMVRSTWAPERMD